jgi:hypothetical protein
MKKLLILPLLALLTLAVSGQKTIHDPNAEVRSAKNFHAISVSSGIDLYLSQGEEAVAVSARNSDDAKKISVTVEDGVLKIGYDWKEKLVFTSAKGLKAYVSYKTLDRLSASGGSDVVVDGTIKAANFTMSISGGSDFKGKLEAQTVRIDQSGGSDIDISGSADVLKVHASGGSDFDGYDFTTNKCTAEASGGSDIHITVNQELKAEASGGSDVLYRGAATVDSNKSGGSSVKKTGR